MYFVQVPKDERHERAREVPGVCSLPIGREIAIAPAGKARSPLAAAVSDVFAVSRRVRLRRPFRDNVRRRCRAAPSNRHKVRHISARLRQVEPSCRKT